MNFAISKHLRSGGELNVRRVVRKFVQWKRVRHHERHQEMGLPECPTGRYLLHTYVHTYIHINVHIYYMMNKLPSTYIPIYIYTFIQNHTYMLQCIHTFKTYMHILINTYITAPRRHSREELSEGVVYCIRCCIGATEQRPVRDIHREAHGQARPRTRQR